MILHLDTISVNLLLLHLLLLQDVFRAAYVTAEGFHPRVHKVRQVANISDAVDSMTKNFGDYGIAQYYQFRIFFDIEGNDRAPRVQGRQSTVGDESFRSLNKRAGQACSDSTPIFDNPADQIVWPEIPAAQLKEKKPKPLAEYKKTIGIGSEQWTYSEDQQEALFAMWHLLASEEPIEFHWLNETDDLAYHLWPFRKSSASLLNRESKVAMAREPEWLSNRGPGSGVADNPFDPLDVQKAREVDPLRSFKPGMTVLIRPDALDNNKVDATGTYDGFWLGRLVETPDPVQGEIREEEDVYIGFHFWGRKKKSVKLPWFHRSCAWEAQRSANGLAVQAISVDSIGTEVKLNKTGVFTNSNQNLDYINYYRDLWFKLEKNEWLEKS